MQFIDFGGKTRPISFATRMAFEYETIHKRSFQADLFNLSLAQAIFEVDQGRYVVDDKTPHVVTLANIIDAALQAGAWREKQPIDWDVREVVGWMDDSPEAVSLIISGIYNVLPRETEGAEKKTKPTRGQKTRTRPLTGMR